MRQALYLLGLTAMGLAFLTASASADTACIAGNFSTIAGTTCDIGSLQFTMGNIGSVWGNGDFEFAPVSNGFTLTFLGGPRSITAPANYSAWDYAYLTYGVVDLDGWLTAESVSGGALSISSGSSEAGYYGSTGAYLCSGLACAWEYLYAGDWTTGYGQIATYPIHSGSGYAAPFELYGWDGSSATWDGTPTTFWYTTTTTPPPPLSIPICEPSSVLLLSTGLVSLVALVRRKVGEGF